MKRLNVTVATLSLVVVASTAFAQQRGGGGFGRGGVASLLTMEEVQKELSITDAQKEKLQALRGERGDFQNLSREERQKRTEELAKKAEETIKTVLDAKQQMRFAELRIQRDGGSSLIRVEIADKLGLDQGQKDQIAKIQADSASPTGFDFQNASEEERTKFMTEARERREKANAAMVAVLTAAQKEAFQKMQGAKFTFPPPGQGRRGQ